MELSIFLAKVIGIYFILLSPFYLYRRDLIDKIFDNYFSNPGLVIITGVFTLILGLLIVVSHNVWEWNYKVIITIVGYISVIKGLTNIYVPEWSQNFTRKLDLYKASLVYSSFFILILGFYLTYVGFFQ